MSRIPERSPWRAVAATFALILSVAGCTGGEGDKEPAKELPAIAPIEGMKYYVGGPVMKYDKYNRLRLGGFNGEVAAPTSRGLLLGYKVDADGKHFDYRTWLNGRAVSQSKGFLDEAGLLWFTERDTFDSEGKVIARQSFAYDDARMVMVSTVSQIDPATGQVLSTNKQEMPYTPPEEPDDEDEEDEEGEGDEAEGEGGAE
jgi:hypothetical protein